MRGIVLINIFDSKASSKSSNKRSSKRNKSHSLNLSKIGEKKLSRINPMAFGILAIKVQENPYNEFLNSSFRAISESPHMLTDKWIDSINKFVDSTSKAIMLDPPDFKEGDRVSLESLIISKVVDPKSDAEYPMPALICLDDRGWKFYFKTSKAYRYSVGDVISFTATVSSHKDGISFMRRPSKIRKSETLTNKVLADD